MTLLILDFLRRWWWVFAIACVVSFGGALVGFGFVVAPAAVVALLLDAQRGLFRTVRPLPVSRRDQARVWWMVGVPLLPLLSVPVLAMGTLIHQAVQSPAAIAAAESVHGHLLEAIASRNMAPAPWFAAGVQVWVSLGYAGLCFFVVQWLPTRPAVGVAEHVQQAIGGMLWGLSVPGVAVLIPSLPRTPAAIAPWHCAVFAAVPVFVLLSYFSAPEVVQRRTMTMGAKIRPPFDAEPDIEGGKLRGVALYVVNFGGRIVMFIALIAAAQALTMRFILGPNQPANNPALVLQVTMLAMMVGVLMVESVGLRILRALPLSTVRLAILMSLIPWFAAVCCAAFFALGCGLGDPGLPRAMNFAGQALAICGWATLALAVTLHTSSTGRLFLLAAFGMVPAAGFAAFAGHTAIIAAAGAVSGVAGFVFLLRGLRRSSAFYRPRGFFGMGIGQPGAVR